MAVGTQVVRLNIYRLVVVGREARSLYVSAVNEGSLGRRMRLRRDRGRGLTSSSRPSSGPGDLVLFKSSNGIGLRHLGDRIACPHKPPKTLPSDLLRDLPQPPPKGVHSCDCTADGRRQWRCSSRCVAPRCSSGSWSRKGYGQFIRDDGPTSPPHQARHAHHGRRRHHRWPSLLGYAHALIMSS